MFEGDMYLFVIDANSKWPEIINCKRNTDAKRVIKEFDNLFVRFGFPIHCVTDGGPQFRSLEITKSRTHIFSSVSSSDKWCCGKFHTDIQRQSIKNNKRGEVYRTCS